MDLEVPVEFHGHFCLFDKGFFLDSAGFVSRVAFVEPRFANLGVWVSFEEEAQFAEACVLGSCNHGVNSIGGRPVGVLFDDFPFPGLAGNRNETVALPEQNFRDFVAMGESCQVNVVIKKHFQAFLQKINEKNKISVVFYTKNAYFGLS